jgi:phosphoesterase RecJ-like protein
MPTPSDSQKLKELINKSNKILITSHISPDADSICSMLLLGLTLETNFPDKSIAMISEEKANNLKFLPGHSKIKTQYLADTIDGQDLIIIVDAMNFGRCTRGDHQVISHKVKEKDIPVAIVDHHESVGIEENAVYINDFYPAAVEQVYNTCFNQLNFSKPDGYAEITMTGLYSDTGGFTYLNGKYKQTLELIGQLLDTGVKIEDIKNQLDQYTEDQIHAVAELSNNATHYKGYSYTFLSDKFMQKWLKDNRSLTDLHRAANIFADNYIRNIDGRRCGFLIYADPLLGSDYYSISFRSVGGSPDVSAIARKINGGGHKGAAGGRIQATSVEEAIQKIQNVIAENS